MKFNLSIFDDIGDCLEADTVIPLIFVAAIILLVIGAIISPESYTFLFK